MPGALVSVGATLGFGLLICTLVLILWFTTHKGATPRMGDNGEERALPQEPIPHGLDPACILEWEFGYAQTTASEAMQDRHTMVSFYLLAVGVVTSGAMAILAEGVRLPSGVAAGLLWLLCCVGWLYLLKLIRLRQAWHSSARAMNQIKMFYIAHVRDIAPSELLRAFRMRPKTLPPPYKTFNVFFYSATLIALLNSAAFVGGGAVLNLRATLDRPVLVLGCLGTFGLAFFAFHIWAYLACLGFWDRAPARTNQESV